MPVPIPDARTGREVPLEIIDTPSPNHGPRRGTGPIDMLVLHYTGMENAAASLARLCDPEAQVSAHYLIEESGRIHRLVAESERAWHAGVAYWRGERDVNSRSIGIELQNPGHEFGYTPFPEPQIAALIALCQVILQRHPIRSAGIVGHSDVAPDRKTDPGELFPWPRLAASGIGCFPEPLTSGSQDEDPGTLAGLLTRIGYDPEAEGRIAAFQRRFRPAQIDGRADTDCVIRAQTYLSHIEND
jgi:N-acetylmuramoyl-L-alanine amidase